MSAELLVRDLSGNDLGRTVAVAQSGRIIVGTLREVQHKTEWNGEPGSVFLLLDVDGLRWMGHVAPDTDVSPERFAVAADEAVGGAAIMEPED